MPQILIVEKTGSIKSVNVKNYSDAELYRKAGLKNADGFANHASWSADLNGKLYTVNLYGKTEGKSGQENKYEFPPPVDSVLFFGSCILVNTLNNIVVDFQKTEWDQIYEYLYGGFEELESEEEDDDDEDDDDDEAEEVYDIDAHLPKTKEGYVKDGFIVSNEEEEEDDEEVEEEEEEEEEYIPVKKVSKKAVKKTQPIAPMAANNKKEKKETKKEPKKEKKETNIEVNSNYLDCASELVMEEYMEPTV